MFAKTYIIHRNIYMTHMMHMTFVPFCEHIICSSGAVFVYACMCMYTHTHTHIHIHTHTHTHTSWLYRCISKGIHDTHTHACMCMYTHTHIHIHTHTPVI